MKIIIISTAILTDWV